MYGDIVIEHVDLYSNVHTRCVVVHRRTQHAAQIELAACCVAVVPIDNNGK